MFEELGAVLSSYKQSVLHMIDSCVAIVSAQHQGIVNLINEANDLSRDIQQAQVCEAVSIA